MAVSRICSIKDCCNPARTRGWCSMHYARWLRNGDLNSRQPKRAECSVGGCVNSAHAKGLCSVHYARFRRYGSPVERRTAANGEAMAYLLSTILPYKGEDCLKWPFDIGDDGYGRIWEGSRKRLVSRVVAERVLGAAPTALHEAAHNCGNGKRGCVNPTHLRWATRSENHRDKVGHGTHNRGERHNFAKMSNEDIGAIRALAGSETLRATGERFGISESHVRRIQKRERWKHLV